MLSSKDKIKEWGCMKLWGQGHRGPIAAKFIPRSDGKRYAEVEAVVGLRFWVSAGRD
ncbi:MAG: hypothetical protein VXX31_14570 [Planctomycetota bacterium]|nr:hypothetical protein [Planctomycetota bacterium]MEC8864178.1 hypothetical protein [Planctomycetota bacterium]